MKESSEVIAKQLCQAMCRAMTDADTRCAATEIRGHWFCSAERGALSCKIWPLWGKEFSTRFVRDSEAIATSRDDDRDRCVAAACDWLAGESLEQLYQRYPSVNRKLRGLSVIRDEVLATEPRFADQASPMLSGLDTNCKLVFEAGDRACKIHYWGKNEFPDAKFIWDRNELFVFRADDNPKLASVLTSWLIDGAMPSEMRARFPWLEIGELADYFERGEPVIGEYVLSWNKIEAFYGEFLPRHGTQMPDALFRLIDEMRRAGYDRLLRAKTSLNSLGLSRSRRNRPRRDQPSLWFRFQGEQMSVQANFGPHDLADHPMSLTEEVCRLLDALSAEPIT